MLYIPEETKRQGLEATIESIAQKARSLFGWSPRWLDSKRQEPFFTLTQPEPLTDSVADLNQALSKHLSKQDVVLTTPVHKNIFEEAGAKNVVVYDISPLQLNRTKGKGERYWCDVFHSGLLSKLLEQVQPSLMYLSNIPEWATEGSNQIEELAITLNEQASLKKVMLARITHWGDESNIFADTLASLGWNLEVFQADTDGDRKVFTLTRE